MNRALLVALIAIVAAGIGGGFWAVGGPGYARMERHDAQRAEDLQQLAMHYRCVDALDPPKDGVSPRYCGGATEMPDLTDPVTGAPYLYSSANALEFEVCATFETAEFIDSNQRNRQLYFDGQVGCLRYRRARAGAEWVQQ